MKTQNPWAQGIGEPGNLGKPRDSRKSKELAVRDLKEPENMGKAGSQKWNALEIKNQRFIQALISILALAFAMVLLYIGSFIPYDSIVSRQIQAFQAAEQDSRHYGYLQPQVVDGFSEEPLAGAVIVVPETGNRFVTSEDGRTAVIQVPIREDEHFAKISAKPWSEITLIVYKEGYLEYVLFHTHVWENQTRKGPKILLFPRVEGEEQEPFSVVEGPHRLWVRDLVGEIQAEGLKSFPHDFPYICHQYKSGRVNVINNALELGYLGTAHYTKNHILFISGIGSFPSSRVTPRSISSIMRFEIASAWSR